jgi:hypothetical protein
MADGRGYHRFDSLTDLKSYCRETYMASDVWAGFDGRELWLRVELPDLSGFEVMVIHLEGEWAYLVRLPVLAVPPTS